jgi:hypothetical protein
MMRLARSNQNQESAHRLSPALMPEAGDAFKLLMKTPLYLTDNGSILLLDFPGIGVMK